VQPADFTEIQSSNRAALGAGQSNSFSADVDSIQAFNNQALNKRESRSREFAIAWIVTIVGFFLMISGI